MDLRRVFLKKSLVWSLITSYSVISFLHMGRYVLLGVNAETTPNKIDLVAVLVDSKISSQLQPQLDWYTVQYIQARRPGTKALILPIDTTSLQAPDLLNIVENLYFDGQKKQSSSLKGIVLIGDLPLPVVSQENRISSNIFPYVDLENPVFVYNKQTSFFEYQEKGDSKAEIWHGLIRFPTIGDYQTYFSKLQKYAQSPSSFVSSKIWYDDFVALKQSLNTDLLAQYRNNFLFAEDIGYHRFTNLLLAVLQRQYGNQLQDLGENSSQSAQSLKELASDPDFSQYLNNQGQLLDDAFNAVSSENAIQGTPTLLLGSTIQTFLKSYQNMISPKALADMRDEVLAGGRRTLRDVDSHMTKIQLNDDLLVRTSNTTLNPVLVDYNTILSQTLVQKVKQNNYPVHVPIITSYEDWRGRRVCFLVAGLRINCGSPLAFHKEWLSRLEGKYQNFYFGQNAATLTGIEDTSIYRGTYKNLTSIEQLRGSSVQSPLSGTESVGASLGFNDRQTLMHRGYNFLKAQEDQDLYANTDINVCDDTKNNLSNFLQKYRGGVSPINTTVDANNELLLGNHDLTAARQPLKIIPGTNQYTGAGFGGALYDPAGSRLTFTGVISEARSWIASTAFASLIKIVSLPEKQNYGDSVEYVQPNFCIPRSKASSENADFFKVFSRTPGSSNRIQITLGSQKVDRNTCGNECDQSEFYTFRTLSSLQVHASPTPEQLQRMNIATLDRPIDSQHSLTFEGIGTENVEFLMPNLYKVPVYILSGDIAQLQTKEQILGSLKTYLRQTVIGYNQKLRLQNSKAPQAYQNNKSAFDFLEKADPNAGIQRSYALLPEDFFITALGEEQLRTIAHLLFKHNEAWPIKTISPTILDQIDATTQQADLNAKIQNTLDTYLSANQENHPLRSIGYNTSGYEVAYLNMQGTEFFGTQGSSNAFFDQVERARIEKQAQEESNKTLEESTLEQELQQECGIEPDGTALLFDLKTMSSPWIKAFGCWIKKTIQKPFSLSFRFDQAQGPIFAGPLFKNNLDPTSQDLVKAGEGVFALQQTVQDTPAPSSETNAQGLSLQDISQRLQIILPNETTRSVGDTGSRDTLVLQADEPTGLLDITILSTGANCVRINNQNTCQRSLALRFDPSLTPKTFPLDFVGQKAGETLITFSVCSESLCFQRKELFTFTPGFPTEIAIQTPSDTLPAGSTMPVRLSATDKYGNPIDQQLQQMVLSVSTGSLGNGASSIRFTDFGSAFFQFSTDTISSGTMTPVTFTVQSTGKNVGDNPVPLITKTLRVLPAQIRVRDAGTDLTQINLSLPDTLQTFQKADNNGIMQALPDGYRDITLSVINPTTGQPLSTMLQVRSAKGLLKIGTFANRPVTQIINGQERTLVQKIFVPSDHFEVGQSPLAIYIRPELKAGNDELLIGYPGKTLLRMPVRILPGSAHKIDVSVSSSTLQPRQTAQAQISISDRRGNIISSPQQIRLTLAGPLESLGQRVRDISITGGKVAIPLTATSPGGKGILAVTLKNIPLNQQLPATQNIFVASDLFPSSGLNAMYLSMWGKNRGEERREDLQNILARSPKTLAITTQTRSQTPIPALSLIINSDRQIRTLEQNQLSLEFGSNGVTLLDQSRPVVKFPSRSWNLQSLQTIDTLKQTPSILKAGDILFVPDVVDSRFSRIQVDGSQIRVNNQVVFDVSNSTSSGIFIQHEGEYYERFPLWVVRYGDASIGKMIIKGDIDFNAISTLQPASSSQSLIFTFFMGSTLDNQAIGVVSSQQSEDEQNVQEQNPFEHLHAFAQGRTAGESLVDLRRTDVIHLGDPFVERMTPNVAINQTSYDGGMGEKIIDTPDKQILKTLPVDFNADGLLDIVTIFSDGTINLRKQYGDKEFENRGDIALLAEGIKDAFILDSVGDGYPDLLIRTQSNRLKIYPNRRGIFAVDGFPVCLNVRGGPDSLENVSQFFVEDMDKDGAGDIVTNDTYGAVTIFYGSQDLATHSYISRKISGCDADRKTRQRASTNVIKNLELRINSGVKIPDGLIHRFGFEKDIVEGTTDFSQAFNGLTNPTLKPNGTPRIPSFGDLNLSTISDQSKKELLRYVSSPTQIVPRYTTLSPSDLRYLDARYTRSSDLIQSRKTYTPLNTGSSLQPGDKVKVRVTVRSDKQTLATFIDRIQGPWKVHLSRTNKITTFSTGTLPTSAQMYRNLEDDAYQYMVEGMILAPGQEVWFEYELEYAPTQLFTIDVKDLNADTYPDIKLYPQQTCTQKITEMINARVQPRKYNETLKDIGKSAQQYINSGAQNTQDYFDDISNALSGITAGGDLNTLPGMEGMKESFSLRTLFGNLGQDFLQNNGQISLNLNLAVADAALDNVQQKIDEGLQGLCNGFKLSMKQGCQGLPVPFNVAFLAPGKFNVMGCHIANDPGFPAFFFPGTLPTPAGPVPVPYGLKGPGDKFIRAPGGSYDSMIRIYAAPTLTMSMGVAICLGPMGAGIRLPSPLGDIAGNCIVTALPSFLQKCQSNTNPNGNPEGNVLNTDLQDLGKLGQCTQPLPDANELPLGFASSPFEMVDSSAALALEMGVTYGQNRNAIVPGEYFGVLQFSQKPLSVQEEDLNPDALMLRGGQKTNNRIGFGAAIKQTITKCLIQGRLDNQIKYVINNLTNMTIALYLPKVSDLAKGMENINLENFQAQTEQNLQNDLMDTSQQGKQPGQDTLSNLQAKLQKNWIQQSDLLNLSTKVSNPFDSIATLFEQVPLIHVSTRDVNVQIPFIYSEDLIRYSSFLQSYLDINTKKLVTWGGVLNDALNFCGIETKISDPNFRATYAQAQSLLKKQTDDLKKEIEKIKALPQTAQTSSSLAQAEQRLSFKSACFDFTVGNQIEAYLSFNEQAGQLLQTVRKNLKVLDQYKRFPLKLYDRVHVTDRYLSEAAGVVNTFTTDIARWLKVNARRFESYVDTIVLLVGIIKTRQVMIDFSVNRQQQCSTCKNDSYDSYSCTLSFICPPLPVLKIPPFKIPNIYLDFSHINLGMEVLLPRFNFVPTAIPLPRIPELPQPPTFRFNFNIDTQLNLSDKVSVDLASKLLIDLKKIRLPQVGIPTLPVLPSPPNLPPLPSFIPSVHLELPVLPPAPKIPRIAPKIEGIITIAQKIGKLFCIIKGGIGLVAEGTVKSKIEQLTQRTRNVPVFDTALTTRIQSPMKGFDYRIDSYVNFQYNFQYVYDLINGFAQQINTRTTENILTPAQSTVNTISDVLNNNDAVNSINQRFNQNYDLNLNTYHFDDQGNVLVEGDLTQGDEYATVWSQLQRGLAAYLQEDTQPERIQKAQNIVALIAPKEDVRVNEEGLGEIESQANALVDTKRQELSDLKQQVKSDYDGFLDRISSSRLVSDDSFQIDLKTALLESPTQIQTFLAQQPHPMKTYAELNQTFLKGFQNALQKNSPENLRMSAVNHASVNKDITMLQKGLSTLVDAIDGKPIDMRTINTPSVADSVHQSLSQLPEISASTLPAAQQCVLPAVSKIQSDKPLLAQLGNSNTDASAGRDPSLIDFKAATQGVYVPTTSGMLVNVVYSPTIAEQVGTNTVLIDMNADRVSDIVMRTPSQVFIKYANSRTGTSARRPGTIFTTLYRTPTLTRSLLDALNQGEISVRGDTFQIRSQHMSVKYLQTQAQSFDHVTVGWLSSTVHSDAVEGYLLRVASRIDLTKDPDQVRDQLPPASREYRYVLFVPQGSDLTGIALKVPDEITQSPLDRLMTGVVLGVYFYDTGSRDLSFALPDLPRQRNYLQMLSLKKTNPVNAISLYEPASPRSAQIVAGKQLIADTRPPLPNAQLVRNANSEIVSQGTSLQGLVNTNYTLNINREDDNEVVRSRTQYSGQILQTTSGGMLTLTGLFSSGVRTQEIVVGAQDANGNQQTQTIQIRFGVPSLGIEGFDFGGGEIGNIIGRLGKDMDQGSVQFQKLSQGQRLPLTGTFQNFEKTYFDLATGQVIVTGGLFELSEHILFKNPQGATIASLHSKSGKLTIDPARKDRVQLRGDFVTGFPVINVVDATRNIVLFKVYLPERARAQPRPLTLLNGTISLIKLENTAFQSFQGGRCVRSSKECLLYMSPTGQIYAPDSSRYGLEFVYGYDDTAQTIQYTINKKSEKPFVRADFMMQTIPLMGE